jgi:hypothetical protein
MKPDKQLSSNKLSLNKQTVAQLDANQLYAVRAGNVQNQDAATSMPCLIFASITLSCSNC